MKQRSTRGSHGAHGRAVLGHVGRCTIMLPIQQIAARLPLPREFANSMRAATMSLSLGSAAMSSQGGLQRPRLVEQAEGQTCE